MSTPPTSARRTPIGLIAGAIAALVIPLFAILAWLAWQWQALAWPVQSALRVLVFGVPIAAGTAGAYVGIVALYRRWADQRAVDADKVIELTRAQRQLPDALTNLSYSYHDSHHALPALETVPSLLELPPPTVPTFSALLDAGAIGPGQPLCLGYDASGQALTGSWNDLYSCGIGGMTGSGKSWAVAFLAGQSAAAGARIILIDPHAGDSESLSNRLAGLAPSFVCDVASTPSAIEMALKLAADKLENRRTGRGGTWPLLLICDEWTSLLRGKLEDVLTSTALDIAEQGRKFGVFALLAAQAWQVAAAGQVRDRLASHYVLRTRGDQFRYQTGLRTGMAPDDTLTLRAGQAYMLSVRGDLQKVTIPEMTPADIARLGALIDKPAAAVAPPFGFHKSTLPPTLPLTPSAGFPDANGTQTGRNINNASTVTGSLKSASPDASRAASLFLAGKGIAEIASDLRGVDITKGGRAARPIREEIEQLIREGLGQ